MVDLPPLPAVVVGHVSHSRRMPLRHRFRYRTYQWLVDVDALPRGRFSAKDHLGLGPSLRDNVATFTAAHGVQLRPDDRVVMLANAKSVFGFVFDPLSVFWCLSSAGELRCVVLEIHNTYGERHAQLAKPDAAGRFTLGKEFYVSPFFTVNGRYDVTLRLDQERVAVAIDLVQHDRRVFSAAFTGRPRPAGRRTVVRAALLTPLLTHQIWLLIRMHGVWLWLRRLPVIRREPHVPPEGVR
ncbi:DUF1365 domain-containing protein [Kribbella sp. CA-293567]|uniref:DUF1365 domain-containing protein n=1 Tax=Kribbella sp. CA-293567 TaxID=3002436 RepID=UPI0022DDC0B3|nr:DUF1365 domain-containing protein [Kribbella sp. CA-293567]WBQ02817.1 DUF1365 domain-containing protein [Kribbella sp. CA-293567]